ncbi:VWA domain-containing protein [soil metagenome]
MKHRITPAPLFLALAAVGVWPVGAASGVGWSSTPCDTDAQTYVDDYPEFQPGDETLNASALPPSAPATGDMAEEGSPVVGPIEPPPPPIEPGILDDNTFVDAGDSLWVETVSDRESTFALDVDTGSWNVAQSLLADGYRPVADSIRAEEWVNAFDYGDPPATGGVLAVTVEAGRPMTIADQPDTAVVRVGVQSQVLDDAERPAAHITFVVDTSGSMDIRERLGLVKSSLTLLVQNLRPDDTIAIVTYGDSASPLLSPTPVRDCERIIDAIDSMSPGGSTNLESGLLLGYDQARESFDADAVNVVVLASDGVANVGVTDAVELTDEITQAGEDGIHLVTVGFGMGNYNDHLMEQLADMGDGFHAYVDDFAEAKRLFVDDLTPTLVVVAEQARIQVVFDPDVVTDYRLIGYENRMLDDEQFSDDTVDAGEIGAGHQVSAVYEVRLAPAPTEVATVTAGQVRLRWADPSTGEFTEIDTDLVIDPTLLAESEGSDSLRLAATVAATAEVLRGSSVVTERGITLDELSAEAHALDDAGVESADALADFIDLELVTADPE